MEKKKEFIINVIFIGVICAIAYMVVKYLLPVLAPFIFGFFFAYIAMKLCRNLFKNEAKLYRGLALLLEYLVIVVVVVVVTIYGFNEIADFIKTIPSMYKDNIVPAINSFQKYLDSLNKSLPDSIESVLANAWDGIFDSLKNVLSYLASGMVSLTTSIIVSTPEFFVSVLVAVVSSFYIAFDYENIASWFTEKLLPRKALIVFYDIKEFIEGTLVKIILSYIKIMGVTFVELLIGFVIIRIENAGVVALVTSVLDIFPVLGVGTVLIPWGIIELVSGKTLLGIELLVLYAIISVIRNIIEPKIVGNQLQLHPLVALVAMIVGLKLFGVAGMLALPLAISFIGEQRRKKVEQ